MVKRIAVLILLMFSIPILVGGFGSPPAQGGLRLLLDR